MSLWGASGEVDWINIKSDVNVKDYLIVKEIIYEKDYFRLNGIAKKKAFGKYTVRKPILN